MTQTPGPWQADRSAPDADSWEVFRQDEDGRLEFVAEFLGQEDARLIAAAPEMAALCAEFFGLYGHDIHVKDDTYYRLRDLLARIRGDNALDPTEAPEGLIQTEYGDMCPNCVTPWKCNGPHLQPPRDPTEAPYG